MVEIIIGDVPQVNDHLTDAEDKMAPFRSNPRQRRLSHCAFGLIAFALAALLATTFACLFPTESAHALAAPSNSGALYVKNGKLTSAKTGKTAVLRGVSLHGLAWYPQYVNKSAFGKLRRSWKANVVRLPLYTSEYGGYCSGGDKKQLLKLIDDGVRYATENDMYVIIDWHTLSDSNPNTNAGAAKKFFATVSRKYRKHNKVIYEICNEPNGATSWSDVKAYAAKVIPKIRKNTKRSVILVGTPEWCQRIDSAASSPLPKSLSRNVMYTFHYYAATHTDALRDRLEAALQSKVPVFVSEYGICDASGNGRIDKQQAAKWAKLLMKYQVSSCAWNLSNKNETSAMIKERCKNPESLSYKNLSTSGKWVYTALRKSA